MEREVRAQVLALGGGEAILVEDFRRASRLHQARSRPHVDEIPAHRMLQTIAVTSPKGHIGDGQRQTNQQNAPGQADHKSGARTHLAYSAAERLSRCWFSRGKTRSASSVMERRQIGASSQSWPTISSVPNGPHCSHKATS